MTTIAEIDNRSLCIFIERLADGSNKALGTGCFFMHRDLVLTAKHVLEKAVHERRQLFIANGSDQGNLFGARPELFLPHPTIDLALVKVSEQYLNVERPLYPAHFSLNKNSGSIAIGYSKSLSNNAANDWTLLCHHVKSFTVQERERSVSPVEYTLEFESSWITPGCSGGPVITLGGGVVAVLIDAFAECQDTTEAIPKASGRATSVYPIMQYFRSPFDYLTTR